MSDDPSSESDAGRLPEEAPTLPPAHREVAPTMHFSSTSELVGTSLPRTIGDYEVLDEIARGGMGVVYRARQKSLNRIVALKMILGGGFASKDDVARFFTEAEAAARLDHPAIVPIYEINHVEGNYFYSMKYVDGGSLATRVDEFRATQQASVTLMIKVARAVHHAHQRGILHRDLKPANILLDATGEPMVSDLGLAKQIGSDSHLTQSGAILGTPAYMSPEQATAKRDVTTAADIYALGAILYQLLTGRPPFTAESPIDTLLRVLEHNLVPPRELNPHIDRELDLICRKCLELEPDQRYTSAAALADDLENWLHGRPVSVVPPSLTALAAQWFRTHLRSAVGAAVIGIVSGLVLGFLLLIPNMAGTTSNLARAYQQFPADRPALASWLSWVIHVPVIVRSALPFILITLLSIVGLLNALVLRPKTRETAVAAGLISGLIVSILTYLISTGWTATMDSSAHASAHDIRLLADTMWSDQRGREQAQSAVLRRYPGLTSVPAQQRGRLLYDKIIADQVAGIPPGLWWGLIATALVILVPIVATTVWASALQQHYRDRGVVLGRYFEVAPLFTAAVFLIVLNLFHIVYPAKWIILSGVFLAAAGALIAALLNARWQLRVLGHSAWWVLLILMIRDIIRVENAQALAAELIPQHRYSAAANYLERLVDFDPSRSFNQYQLAVLRLYMRDESGYREQCNLLLTDFPADVYEPTSADRVAKVCLLRPDLQTDVRAVHQLARTAADYDEHQFRNYFYMCRALSEYRLQNYLESQTWCAKALDGAESRLLVATTKLILANCYRKTGNLPEAQALQQQADDLAEAESPSSRDPDWADRMFFQILRAQP